MKTTRKKKKEIPVPPIKNPESEPWYKSKRVQGIVLFVLSYFMKKYGIEGGLADSGMVVGAGWAGFGFKNAQDRQTKIASAVAAQQGIAVPPPNSILNTLKITSPK